MHIHIWWLLLWVTWMHVPLDRRRRHHQYFCAHQHCCGGASSFKFSIFFVMRTITAVWIIMETTPPDMVALDFFYFHYDDDIWHFTPTVKTAMSLTWQIFLLFHLCYTPRSSGLVRSVWIPKSQSNFLVHFLNNIQLF